MPRLTTTLLLAFTLLLEGCGSSAPPPMAASCSTRLLRSGQVEAKVAVKNNMSGAHRAVVYGPALRGVQFVHPVLTTVDVIVHSGHSAQSFTGWVLYRIPAGGTSHVTFKIARPTAPVAILAAQSASVHVSSNDGLKNGDCTVG